MCIAKVLNNYLPRSPLTAAKSGYYPRPWNFEFRMPIVIINIDIIEACELIKYPNSKERSLFMVQDYTCW